MKLLKLAALDAEDLQIISAHMQDAILKVGDMSFLPSKARFAMVANRFDWPALKSGAGDKPRRVRTGVHFERVLDVKSRNIRQQARDGVLELLAMTYKPDDEPPGGTIELIFSGDGVIRLKVECVEAWLEDLGMMWAASGVPSHEDDED